MAKTYYLWSPVNLEVSDYGKVEKVAEVGTKVTPDDLNMSKEEFANLVAVGSIRTEPYPDIPADVAPAEYYRTMTGEDSDLTSSEKKELEAFRRAEAEATLEPAAPPVAPNK